MKLLFIIIFSFLFFITSCDYGTSDNYVEMEKDVPVIDLVEVHDNINVVLLPDTFYKVRLAAPEDLIHNIFMDTINGALHIKNENKNNWKYYNDSITVYLFFGNQPLKIQTNGTGIISSVDTIKTNYLRCYAVDGSGCFNILINAKTLQLIAHSFPTTDFNFFGKTNYLSTHLKGMGQIHLEKLEADNANMIYNGTNECIVNVKKLLVISIRNIGNVYYIGQPDSIKLEREGEGNLIPYNKY